MVELGSKQAADAFRRALRADIAELRHELARLERLLADLDGRAGPRRYQRRAPGDAAGKESGTPGKESGTPTPAKARRREYAPRVRLDAEEARALVTHIESIFRTKRPRVLDTPALRADLLRRNIKVPGVARMHDLMRAHPERFHKPGRFGWALGPAPSAARKAGSGRAMSQVAAPMAATVAGGNGQG